MSEEIVKEKPKRVMPKWDDPLPVIDENMIPIVDMIMLGQTATKALPISQFQQDNLKDVDFLYQNIKKSKGEGWLDLIQRIETLKPIVDRLYLIAKEAKKTKKSRKSPTKPVADNTGDNNSDIVKSNPSIKSKANLEIIRAAEQRASELKQAYSKKRSRPSQPRVNKNNNNTQESDNVKKTKVVQTLVDDDFTSIPDDTSMINQYDD
jgi:hypothetical protein